MVGGSGKLTIILEHALVLQLDVGPRGLVDRASAGLLQIRFQMSEAGL